MKKDIYLKLSFSENQIKAIEQYAELMETTKAGSIMHMIDICSFIGDLSNKVMPALSAIEQRPEFNELMLLPPSEQALIQYYKLKSELVKLSILHKKWEPVNKIEWSVDKIK